MKKRVRQRSTARDPFNAFREIGPRLTVYDDIFDGTAWDSANTSSYEIDWGAFLKNNNPQFHPLIPGIKASLILNDLPIASTLVGYTASMFEFMAQVVAAPTVAEIQEQLSLLLTALRHLGSLAQGANGSQPMEPRPIWFTREDDDEGRRHFESLIREANNRTPTLHPILQDHINMVYETKVHHHEGLERDCALAELAERQTELIKFFDKVPHIIKAVEIAENTARQRANSGLLNPPRAVGAPQDKPRNWAMIRLMWIYRDVFLRDITIYLRKQRGRTRLDPPEPEGCMAFVVAALESFNPVGPHELDSLERRLMALRSQVPPTPLVRRLPI